MRCQRFESAGSDPVDRLGAGGVPAERLSSAPQVIIGVEEMGGDLVEQRSVGVCELDKGSLPLLIEGLLDPGKQCRCQLGDDVMEPGV